MRISRNANFSNAAGGVLLSAALFMPSLGRFQQAPAGNQSQAPAPQSAQPGQAPAANAPAPAPLFQGKTNLRSSRQTKDTASAGFNGIGPSGAIDKKLLASDATAADDSAAYQLSNFSVSQTDLNAFIAAGNLKGKK